MGDRIAIMSRGALRCCGSSLYLKSKYSSGYNLILTKKQPENGTDVQQANETNNRLKTLVEKMIPDARLNENLNSEISFILPSEHTAKFGELFKSLEANKDYLNVNNIGISISTLEDVFLKYAFHTLSTARLIISLIFQFKGSEIPKNVRTQTRTKDRPWILAQFRTERSTSKTTAFTPSTLTLIPTP